MKDFFIDDSSIHGFGCFTRANIKAGQTFTVPILPVDTNELDHHVFPLKNGPKPLCVVLSEFTYCNHSDEPNFKIITVCSFGRFFIFEALTDINPYTEITLKY